MRRLVAAALLLVLAGCDSKDSGESGVDQMLSAIQPDMTQDQIIRAYSQPGSKSHDPTSGQEIWSYEPEAGKGTVLVFFTDEKVTGVKSKRL